MTGPSQHAAGAVSPTPLGEPAGSTGARGGDRHPSAPPGPVVATVPCAHCRAPVPLEFEPEPNTGYVCDPCADDYQRHVAENMARTFGADAFRCERCGMPTLGDPKGARLCDPCEDALHAEALEDRQ